MVVPETLHIVVRIRVAVVMALAAAVAAVAEEIRCSLQIVADQRDLLVVDQMLGQSPPGRMHWGPSFPFPQTSFPEPLGIVSSWLAFQEASLSSSMF